MFVVEAQHVHHLVQHPVLYETAVQQTYVHDVAQVLVRPLPGHATVALRHLLEDDEVRDGAGVLRQVDPADASGAVQESDLVLEVRHLALTYDNSTLGCEGIGSPGSRPSCRFGSSSLSLPPGKEERNRFKNIFTHEMKSSDSSHLFKLVKY